MKYLARLGLCLVLLLLPLLVRPAQADPAAAVGPPPVVAAGSVTAPTPEAPAVAMGLQASVAPVDSAIGPICVDGQVAVTTAGGKRLCVALLTEDTGALASIGFTAARSGNWFLLGVSILVLILGLLRKFGAKLWAPLGSASMTRLLVIGTTLGATLGGAVQAGVQLDLNVLLGALGAALLAWIGPGALDSVNGKPTENKSI